MDARNEALSCRAIQLSSSLEVGNMSFLFCNFPLISYRSLVVLYETILLIRKILTFRVFRKGFATWLLVIAKLATNGFQWFPLNLKGIDLMGDFSSEACVTTYVTE